MGTYLVDVGPGDVYRANLTIKNNGKSAVELLHCEMLKKVRVFTLNDPAKVTDGLGTAILKSRKIFGSLD